MLIASSPIRSVFMRVTPSKNRIYFLPQQDKMRSSLDQRNLRLSRSVQYVKEMLVLYVIVKNINIIT